MSYMSLKIVQLRFFFFLVHVEDDREKKENGCTVSDAAAVP